MASDATPVLIPATSLVHGSQAPTQVTVRQSGGNSVPPSGNVTAAAATAASKSGTGSRTGDAQAQVAFLNKYLNDSGKPDQFRVAPNSNSTLIQEVNPATGEVIGEYPAIAFPALAQKTISFPTQDGGLIFADIYGRGVKTVVLAHGGQFNKESWGPQARTLATDRGIRCVTLDYDTMRGTTDGALRLF